MTFLIFFTLFVIVLIKIQKNHEQKIYQKYKQKQKYSNHYMREETMNATNIAKHFNISAKELNKIFEELGWIYKRDRWWLATELGEEKGAKEYYDVKRKTKYIKWNPDIKNNMQLTNKIHNMRTNQNSPRENPPVENDNIQKETKKKTTYAEKKAKGDEYEKYIADFFREQAYYVWEHGKEKGVQDSSIDLIIKKDKNIYFVQCKNWENWKINHKEVKATRTDVREYLKREKLLWNLIKNYESKILYVTPKECLSKSAYTYIQENSDIVEYKVIPYQ